MSRYFHLLQMTSIQFQTTVKDGLICDKESFRAIKTLVDGCYIVSIKKAYWKRSGNQNAFYWGFFLDAELEVLKNEGWHFKSKDDLHEWNKENFNRKTQINELTGEVRQITGSTANENTVEFEEYLERIRNTFREMYMSELPYPINNEESN